MSQSPPKAALYTFGGSVWGSVPLLGLVEKGYSDSDLDVKTVDLMKAENFSPSYLRINSNATVPSLVVPLLETTGAQVDTKFRALTDSKAVLEFLDQSRSQPILESKGEGADAAPAPVLAPATIEGKALSDSLIKLVHDEKADPNFLLLGSRDQQDLNRNKDGVAGSFVKTRHEALKRYQAEVIASSTAGSDNPRAAATAESLKKWYANKLESEALLVQAYLQGSPDAAQTLFQATKAAWSAAADTVHTLENSIKGPFALGDQISLADLHIIPWLARVSAVASSLPEAGGASGIDALDNVLKAPHLAGHSTAPNGVGPKLREWWTAVQERPSFKRVYADGLH